MSRNSSLLVAFLCLSAAMFACAGRVSADCGDYVILTGENYRSNAGSMMTSHSQSNWIESHLVVTDPLASDWVSSIVSRTVRIPCDGPNCRSKNEPGREIQTSETNLERDHNQTVMVAKTQGFEHPKSNRDSLSDSRLPAEVFFLIEQPPE